MALTENTVRSGSWILTRSGRHPDFLDPRPGEIEIFDIAVALSRECRFSGQTRRAYSVAQHSVLVSRIVPEAFAREALLHDATEAYLRDLSRPLKHLVPEYLRIERRLDRVIRQKFGLPAEKSDPVDLADRILLATEKRDLMPPDPDWEILAGIRPLPGRIVPWPEGRARTLFLRRFAELWGGGEEMTGAGTRVPAGETEEGK